MTPESWAGFGFVLSLWDQTILELLAATAPLFEALAAANLAVAALVPTAWLFLITMRVADVGFVRGLVTGLMIFLGMAYGLSPTTITLPHGGVMHATKVQEGGLQIAMGLHKLYRSVLVDVLSSQTVAGSILPAQAAMDRAVGRSAALYEGSDLAQLIRDYNSSCAPQATELAGPANSAKVEALHAVGLLGGGGLGIPDDEVGVLAQIKTGAGGVLDFLRGYLGDTEANGGHVSWLLGGGIRMGSEKVRDLRAMQERREEGLKILAEKGPFMGGRYALPTQQHWEAVFAGRQDVNPSYLPISLIPGQKSAAVSDEPATIFTPGSCEEAYKIAQLGAEQAYKAMKATGAKMPGGQAVSSEAGTIASTVAWQKFLSQSLQQTGMQQGNAEVSGWMLSIVQLFKDVFSWLDLQTLFPAFVVINAWLFVLLILLGPMFVLLAPLRGVQVFIQWCQLLLFCVMTMIVLHILTIALSQAVAASAFTQSATAAGWQGGAPDDALRGSTGIVGAMLLAIVSWLVARMTGVDVSALAGSMTGAVSTASGAAKMVSRAIGGMYRAGRMMSGKATTSPAGRPGSPSNAGNPGARVSSGGGGSAPSPIRVVMTQFTPQSQRKRTTGGANKTPGTSSLNPPKPQSNTPTKPPGQPGA